MSISQKYRLFSFDSPLGPDKLLLNSFHGTEQLSEIYQFELELVSEDFTLTWDQIVDRNVTVGIRYRETMDYRYFNGYISKFEPIRHAGRLAYYKAEMVPWPWYLTLTTDNLIYQEMTVVQVIEKTFQKHGFTDYDVSSLGDRHAKWINCCQYQESAFHFVSRLMEIEGIYYYFKQEQGKHTMILVDHLSAHEPCPNQSTMVLEHETGAVTRTTDTIFESNMAKVIRPNKYAHKDYNFLIPSHQLYYEAPTGQFMGSNRVLEVYDYPGDIDWEQDSPDWAALRQEELELDRVQVAGKSNCRAMMPGYRFDLTNHDRPEQDLNYLIVKVTHSAHEGSFTSTDSAAATYENSFTTIPSTVQFRPKCKTETPSVGSIQTAHVVGPEGEEIYTDQYGRVKVHFHWDRTQSNENSSCWIRVMQPIAGPGFGHIWLPRVGQEVIVQFVEGDPDRPVITGCLYNHVNHPPYNLPDNKNWSGVKTRSTKNGDATQFNELRFVDTKGDELYVMHAQKNMQITVENDTIEVVDRDRTMQVKRDLTESVGRNQSLTVKGDSSTNIQGQVSINAQKDIHEKAAGTFVLQAGGDIHLKAGGRIVLEAAQGITFLGAGGKSFIDCTQSGITVQGPKVWMNCGLPLPTGALSATPTLPGLPSLPGTLNLSTISNMPDLSNLTSAVSNTVNQAMSTATQAVSSVTNAANQAVSTVTQAASSVTNAANQAVSSVTNVANQAMSTVNQATSSVTNVANQAMSSVNQAISSVTNVANQAMSSVNQATSSVTNVANQAMSSVNQAISPVTNMANQAMSSVNQATSSVTNVANQAMSSVNPVATNPGASVAEQLASNPWVAQSSQSAEGAIDALTSPGSLPPTIEQIEGEES
jgi:type VI secretion system secreted protein VgrG